MENKLLSDASGLLEEAETLLCMGDGLRVESEALVAFAEEGGISDVDEFSNGRIEIFKSYIENWNLTGHADMGVALPDGSTSVHAHNSYLQVIHDHGLLTGAVYMIFGVLSAWMMFGYALKNGEKERYAVLPLAVFIGFAVAGLVEWLFHPCNPLGFSTMIVLAPLFVQDSASEKGGKNRMKKPFNYQLFYRRAALIAYDIVSVVASSFLAILIRYDFQLNTVPEEFLLPIRQFMVINIVLALGIFYLFRLYHSLWAFAGETELQNLVMACLTASVADGVGINFFRMGSKAVPDSYYFLYFFFLLTFLFASRFSYRFFRSRKHKLQNRKNSVSVMIIGAGEAGNAIIKEIVTSNYSTMVIRCIIDDDKNKWGSFIQGIKVVGGRDKIIESADLYDVDEILLAIPSASPTQIRELLEICKETNCKLRSLPGLYQLANGDVNVSKLRDVEVEDLLGREPIRVDMDSILGYVQNKVVLVTGGGGSIGSELCRQIAAHKPSQLIVFDIYENNAYDLQQELKENFPELKLTVLIGSVRNTNRINSVFETYHPDIVYHAAAHKHVPLMEDSPNEAVKNNVFGTWKTAMAAAENHAQKFVMISTDKAVNPTNIMGASQAYLRDDRTDVQPSL